MKDHFLSRFAALCIFGASIYAPLESTGETLEQQLIRHEGYKAKAYRDGKGYSVGYGTRLTGTDAKNRLKKMGVDYNALIRKEISLTRKQAATSFYQDVALARTAATRLVPSYHLQPKEIKDAVVNMIYNLGPTGFAEFVEVRNFLENRKYLSAADEMTKSNWYRNPRTYRRAEELRQQIAKQGKK